MAAQLMSANSLRRPAGLGVDHACDEALAGAGLAIEQDSPRRAFRHPIDQAAELADAGMLADESPRVVCHLLSHAALRVRG